MRKLCISGITANELICRKYAEESVGIATILNRYMGYNNASKIAKKSSQSNKSVIDIIRSENILTDIQLKKIFDVYSLTNPGELKFKIPKKHK